jgi:hypothetical protein
MRPLNSLSFVLGIDPGPPRADASAARVVLTLDTAGTIGLLQPATSLKKDSLAQLLRHDPLLAHPNLRLAVIAAPMTPTPFGSKPWKPRSVEIRLSRGAFAGSSRGPSMPWISRPRCWLRYQLATQLQTILAGRGLPLLAMPADERLEIDLPSRCLAEVYPKATLAMLAPTTLLKDRPNATEFLGQLDDWIFPRLFGEGEILSFLHGCLPLRLAPETLAEAQRIAKLQRPFPRREPLRAFVAAFQGILALQGAACLVGSPGDHEGSILLPALWHSDWESEWNDSRRDRRIQPLRRVPVRSADCGTTRPVFLSRSMPKDPLAVALGGGVLHF